MFKKQILSIKNNNMKFIETINIENDEAIKLAYEDYGSGKPVVLIHGWPLSKEMWEYQLDELVGSGMRVIAYDRRGFGNSSKPWYGYDYDTLATDLNEVLVQLNLEEVTLVGFSMGGGEIARYSSLFGLKKVSRIILISSILPCLLKSTENPEGISSEQQNDMMVQLSTDRIDFLETFGKHFFGVDFISQPISKPLLEYYKTLGSLASPRATKECMKAFTSTDFTIDIKSINVPVLIIHGNADKTVPLAISSQRLAGMIPDSQLIVYDYAAHGLFYTEKDRLNLDIISFIRTGLPAVEYDEDALYDVLPDNDALSTRD